MKNRSLILLSGEGTSLPEAEARSLFLAYDGRSRFEVPEGRVVITESGADPFAIGGRIAFARRVGRLLEDVNEAAGLVRGRTVRLRHFDLSPKEEFNPVRFLRGLDAVVDLEDPEYELTLVRGEREYLALTSPGGMRQAWSLRRPRARAFFHPSAIFPKLARALVNLTRVKEDEVFLDPFCGTGSLALEAALVGARVAAGDRAGRMTAGSLANMKRFGQAWLGVIQCDSLRPPFSNVDAVATDVPYGRASSTMGEGRRRVLQRALDAVPALLASGSRMVLMHSREDAVERSSDLEVEEEHDLHVHKNLTRRISVLRRR